ncbi:Sugar phosphate permease [Noviherbaspirillum humi]|uniref:Sugar phosphate permease n=1 Tax=Noviherbaspirillum humi TaxID=1688639 RepID=A0A239LJF4_9BURK|nr:MFS transporter [Noviherbaspirillum humi]SNT29694.1 Sugar phosphate permease [Noviherbaspirillum humi]
MSTTMTAAPQEIQPRKSFRDVWIITIGHALTHWYPATFYLLLPLIGKELGLNYSQIGLIMTCQYIAGAISNVPGGMLVDTVGKKGLLMAVSLFWVGFPYLLMGMAGSYWMLLFCISLVGIGNNLWHPTAIPTLAQRYPERKGLVLSLHGMGGNAGDALAPLAIGALLATFTWRQIVVMNVVPGAIMSLLILAYLGTLTLGSKKKPKPAAAEEQGQSVKEYAQGLRGLLANRVLIMLTVSSAFRSMTQTTLLTFLPVFLAYEMGFNPFWVGLAMFLLQAAGFAASPVAGHLSDRMGRRRIIMSSMAMTAMVLLAMVFAGKSTAFVIFIAALGFFLYAIRPVLQAWLLDATPKNMGGTSIGMLFGMQAVGSSIGPVIGGFLADRYGLLSTFWFLAATIVIANLFIFFVPASVMAGQGKE